jgi:hypothetical protein
MILSMAGGELTPRIAPPNPDWRRATPNNPPIHPVPKMATVFRCFSPRRAAN